MKSTSVFATSIFILISGLWACQEKTTKAYDPSLMSVPKDCIVPVREELNDTLLGYQISAACATSYIEQYKNYIDAVNDTLSVMVRDSAFSNSAEKLVYGAKVDLTELRNIILASEDQYDDLYLMMGIMPNDSTEIIFALKTTTKTNSNPVWKYFDFTRPCPTSCPQWLVASENPIN